MVNWLSPADLSPLETTIGFEQVAIEVTASVAQHEPDEYLAQVYRFGLLELRSLVPVLCTHGSHHGRRRQQHYSELFRHHARTSDDGRTPRTRRRPAQSLRRHHRRSADKASRRHDHGRGEPNTRLLHDYRSDVCRSDRASALRREIASIEEQHTTQYESLLDPNETPLEKWLLHEAMEVYNYYGCMQYETNPRIRQIWERFCNYELGHLHMVMDLMKKFEKRDPAELLPQTLPEPIEYESHRQFVRETLNAEVDQRSAGTEFIHKMRNRSARRGRSLIANRGTPKDRHRR